MISSECNTWYRYGTRYIQKTNSPDPGRDCETCIRLNMITGCTPNTLYYVYVYKLVGRDRIETTEIVVESSVPATRAVNTWCVLLIIFHCVAVDSFSKRFAFTPQRRYIKRWCLQHGLREFISNKLQPSVLRFVSSNCVISIIYTGRKYETRIFTNIEFCLITFSKVVNVPVLKYR